MFSRVVTVGLLATLVVALIGGSAYILFRSNDTVAVQGKEGYNQRSAAVTPRNGLSEELQGGNGYRGGQVIEQQTEPRGRGEAGSGRVVEGQGERVFENEGGGHPVSTWTTVEGSIVSLMDDELTMEAADGQLAVHLGPEWYWESNGIAVKTGDQVVATGFYDYDVLLQRDFDLASTLSLSKGAVFARSSSFDRLRMTIAGSTSTEVSL